MRYSCDIAVAADWQACWMHLSILYSRSALIIFLQFFIAMLWECHWKEAIFSQLMQSQKMSRGQVFLKNLDFSFITKAANLDPCYVI